MIGYADEVGSGFEKIKNACNDYLIQSQLLKISVSVYKSFLIDRLFFIILSIEKTRRYDIIIQRQIVIYI